MCGRACGSPRGRYHPPTLARRARYRDADGLPQRFLHGRELTRGASRRSAPPARERPRRSLREHASRGRRQCERRGGETSRGKRQHLDGGLRRPPRRRGESRRCTNTEPIPRLQSVPAATHVLTLPAGSAGLQSVRDTEFAGGSALRPMAVDEAACRAVKRVGYRWTRR